LIGRRAALQQREFLRDLVSDEIGPRAQHLPEFDEGGSELGERQAQADGCRQIDDVLAGRSAQPSLNALAGHLPKTVGQAVTDGDADDLPKTPCVPIASIAPRAAVAEEEQFHNVFTPIRNRRSSAEDAPFDVAGEEP
jgi:hypothetical protein